MPYGFSIIDEIAKEVKGQAKVGKINIDEETELAKEYKVMSIPTLMVVKDRKFHQHLWVCNLKKNFSMLEIS